MKVSHHICNPHLEVLCLRNCFIDRKWLIFYPKLLKILLFLSSFLGFNGKYSVFQKRIFLSPTRNLSAYFLFLSFFWHFVKKSNFYLKNSVLNFPETFQGHALLRNNPPCTFYRARAMFFGAPKHLKIVGISGQKWTQINFSQKLSLNSLKFCTKLFHHIQNLLNRCYVPKDFYRYETVNFSPHFWRFSLKSSKL